ncbi:xanthine dehydrogenase family protein molybdopterin-binding subunit [Candidatus Formimonas warabiya]|uniref:Aldehyde oxidase/xanthine dehydrogenase a/b hammerhead domain-containing protein n=1 Tax=Formimonas warabiya TaxID=1761012 RepID=A0A3G1KRA9_FORW1|nr:xanthine dehydrogenase family protein molybdopterin-binding subunit [Candidatus Formimonas warabiya]ATW24991.1 hypothetical protein DCMF_09575 [Candidatus Formimonas warabiya]
MGKRKYVGLKQEFIDAKEKVTGQANYLDDLSFPGMLYGKILRSPHPHAQIKAINISQALKLPGVKGVITADDCPSNYFGLEIADVTMLAKDKVRYVGDEVAAVAATSEEIAQAALSLIKVDYEVLRPVTNVEESVALGALLVHEDKIGNVAKTYHFERGNVDEDFVRCDYVFEEKFSTSRVSACYMEPFGAIARWEHDGRLTIWTGLQAVFHGRNEIAKALGISPALINIKEPFIGGGFGGKIWIRNFHPIVAVLAKKTGCPVKIVLTREEEMLTTRPRVAPKMRLKLGMMQDGTMVAKQAEILADNGAYTWAASKILLNMSMRTDCLYRFKSTRTDAKLVYTNLIPTSGFRGYGNSQMHFALESMIDICCRKIGLDPVQVRLKNASRQGDTTLHGWKLRSCGLAECIEKAAQAIKVNRLPAEAQNGRIKRGIGLACMNHVSGNRGGDNFDGSSAMVRFHEDGKLMVYSGEADLGQGCKTVFAQIAAETMGMPVDHIFVMPLDTDISPFCYGTYSSRVTTVGGRAVQLAVQKVKDQLLQLAAKKMGVDSGRLEINDDVVYNRMDPGHKYSLAEICKYGIRTREAAELTAYITYDPPTQGNDSTGYGDYSSAYTYGAHGVEVEVDTVTGQVRVLRIVTAHDVGAVINPQGVFGQISGGVAQGIGWTLYENQIQKNGIPQNASLRNYILMTIKDMPKIEPILVETNDPVGPFGAKGIGEPTLIPTAPAIANAIQDAVGIRIHDLPITAEKMFWALQNHVKEGEK